MTTAVQNSPTLAGSLESHSRRRWRAIIQSGMAAGAAKLVNMVCSLLQVPIALHYLGSEAFGLWIAITGAVTLLSFMDLGIGVGIQNKIAEAYGKDDLPRARQIFVTGILILSAVGLALAAVMMPLCFIIPWADTLKVTDSGLRSELPGVMAAVVAAFSLGLPLASFSRLAAGLQLGWLVGIWSGIGAVIALALIALASVLHFSFTHFVMLAVLPPILVGLGLGITLFRHLGWSAGGGSKPDWQLRRSLLSQGALFLIPQVNSLILLTAPPVVISIIAGPSSVTPYNLTQRISNVIVQVVAMLIGSLWPAFTEAATRGDWKWVASAYRKTQWLTAGVTIVPCLVFALAGQAIIQWWSRTTGPLPSQQLILLMSLFTWTLTVGQPGFYLLGGCNRLKGISFYATLTSLSFLLLVSPMMARFGIEGAAAALLLSYGAFTLLGSLTEIHLWLSGIRRRNL